MLDIFFDPKREHPKGMIVRAHPRLQQNFAHSTKGKFFNTY